MNKSATHPNYDQNGKLVPNLEERLSYLEKNYDEVIRRLRDVELENHRLENLIKLNRNTCPTYEELYV